MFVWVIDEYVIVGYVSSKIVFDRFKDYGCIVGYVFIFIGVIVFDYGFGV